MPSPTKELREALEFARQASSNDDSRARQQAGYMLLGEVAARHLPGLLERNEELERFTRYVFRVATIKCQDFITPPDWLDRLYGRSRAALDKFEPDTDEADSLTDEERERLCRPIEGEGE